jgi:nucleoid DNA-binding protein
MFNLVDLVQIKTKRKREDVEEILNAAINVTKETLEKGNDVYWVGLCRFTYKQKAKTKAQAKEWTEFPYLAEGDKVRFISELDGVEGKGSVLNIEKTTKGNTNV